MDNVIEIKFGSSSNDSHLGTPQPFAGFLGGNMIFPEIFIERHLDFSQYKSSNDAVATNQAGLADYSFEELREMAEQSSEEQWARNPAYFKALVLEIKSKRTKMLGMI